MKLYELTDKIGILERMMDSDEIIMTDEMQKEMDKLNLEFSLKVRNCASVIKNLSTEAEALKNESHRLNEKAYNINKRVDWLKEYVKTEMEKVDRLKIKTGIFKIRVQRNSQPSIDILDEDSIPKVFKERKEIVRIDKKAILAQIRETGEVPAGVKVEIGTHLRIS